MTLLVACGSSQNHSKSSRLVGRGGVFAVFPAARFGKKRQPTRAVQFASLLICDNKGGDVELKGVAA